MLKFVVDATCKFLFRSLDVCTCEGGEDGGRVGEWYKGGGGWSGGGGAEGKVQGRWCRRKGAGEVVQEEGCRGGGAGGRVQGRWCRRKGAGEVVQEEGCRGGGAGGREGRWCRRKGAGEVVQEQGRGRLCLISYFHKLHAKVPLP